MTRIMSYYKPAGFAFLSLIASVVLAFHMPLYGLILSKIIFVMLKPNSDDFIKNRDFWCGMLLVLAAATFVFIFI